jgi:hypothetical protein
VPICDAQPLSTYHVQRGHTGHGRQREAPVPPPEVVVVPLPAGGEGGQVEHVAAHPTPDPGSRIVRRNDADPGRDLAHPIGAQQHLSPLHTQHPGENPGGQHFCQSEPDTEPAQAASELFGAVRRTVPRRLVPSACHGVTYPMD